MTNENTTVPSNFIQNIIDEDLKNNKNNGNVHTRFPPEPNGYLHIGHAKSICLNFGLAEQYNGLCNLRFDDTNPSKEEVEYVDSIKADVRWLGFDWEDREYFASDYFEKMYDCAIHLIKTDKAFVCDLTADEIRESRGTLTEVGTESPYKDRSVEENLDLFTRMRKGEFADGTHVLRAKIDMTSPNLNMRDPVLYRISHTTHHRTGDDWCIYPMYDFAHPLSDAFEYITHSICTLEFEDHRPLYNWVIENTPVEAYPQQIEFARLNLSHTIMSKRLLLQLVEKDLVSGWDDPRMPTISGLKRRGYTPESIRDFCDRIGVAKNNSTVDMALLEYCIREDLNKKAPRVMAVLNPLKIVIENYPDDKIEYLPSQNNPNQPETGSRELPFSKTVYIEQDDFMENPPKKFFRLSPGQEVRLRHAYIIKCEQVIKDEQTGEILELRCSYDPDTKSGSDKTGKKVKGTLHWVEANNALDVEVRLFDRLLIEEDSEEDDDAETGHFIDQLNPDSLQVISNAKVEPSLKSAKTGDKFQFLRQGYFCLDSDSTPEKLVFNRTVALRDSWAKIKKK